jgi:hypothetical protein
MGTLADALFERSKSDSKTDGWPSIVGSEIRAALQEVNLERDDARGALREVAKQGREALAEAAVLSGSIDRLIDNPGYPVWVEVGSLAAAHMARVRALEEVAKESKEMLPWAKGLVAMPIPHYTLAVGFVLATERLDAALAALTATGKEADRG